MKQMTSEKQKQYDKECYEWLKSKGFCVRCGREKAVSGNVLCTVCKVKLAEISRKYYHKKIRRETAEKGEKL